MRQAKQQKVTETQIKEQIAEFDKALKNQGAMKTLQQRNRGAVMQPGGKRRTTQVQVKFRFYLFLKIDSTLYFPAPSRN